MTPAPHMVSAARALEVVFAELYPQQNWVAEIRERDGDDRASVATVTPRVDESCAVTDDAHAALDRHDAAAAAGARDEHNLDQAA